MIFYNKDTERYFTIQHEKEQTQIKEELKGVILYLEESKQLITKAVCLNGRICRIYHTNQAGEDAITKQAENIAQRAEIYKDGMLIMR